MCKHYGTGQHTMHLFLDLENEVDIRRKTLHEFGHVLSLEHEHQGRAAGYKWRVKAVQERFGVERAKEDILDRTADHLLEADEYDPKSIMHYAIPQEWITRGRPTELSTVLSPGDKRTIRKTYPPASALANNRTFDFGPDLVEEAPVERPYNKIQIPHNHQEEPQVALGISALHVENQRDIRLSAKVRDIQENRFVIDTNALGGTKLYSTTATWFDAKEHLSKFQVGIFKHKHNTPRSKYIKFESPFDSAPEVVVWLNKFHITSNKRMHVKAYASTPGREGFTIHYSVPGDSTLHSGAASWIAYKTPNIASGSFERRAEGQEALPAHMSGEVPLPDGFPQQRQVLVGVNELDFDNEHPMCFKAGGVVEGNNVKLDFRTSGGSVCYGAHVSYLALGGGL